MEKHRNISVHPQNKDLVPGQKHHESRWEACTRSQPVCCTHEYPKSTQTRCTVTDQSIHRALFVKNLRSVVRTRNLTTEPTADGPQLQRHSGRIIRALRKIRARPVRSPVVSTARFVETALLTERWTAARYVKGSIATPRVPHSWCTKMSWTRNKPAIN